MYCYLFEDSNMPRTKRGPGAMQEDLPSKRGGRATTGRPSGSGAIVPAVNEKDLVLRDAPGLPPWSPNPTANIAMMGAAGDDEDALWRSDFEPEEHRRPRITKPSTPLHAGTRSLGSRGRRMNG